MLKSIWRNTIELKSIWRNTLDFPRALSVSAAFSGLLIVLVSGTGPVAILLLAAKSGHLSGAETSSWLWATWIGSGLYGLFLSLWLRIPMIGAWSTPSVALLVVGLSNHSLPQAVGAYFICAVATILVGVTGIFDRILKTVPRPVIMAMLGGILFQFGLAIFQELPNAPLIVITMVVGYFLARRLKWRAPVLTTLIVGFLVAVPEHKIHATHISFALAHPVWINPHFSLSSTITLALPMLLLTLTSQYAPGMAVLGASGYQAPTNKSLITGGAISLLGAGFLGSGVNAAAITAAIGTGEQAEPDKNRRYTAGVVCGIFYILIGLFGSTMVSVFSIVPAAMLAALGGLGLLPAISSSTAEALGDPEYREAAMVTFLVTISNIHPWSLGSPFWGLLAGVAAHQIVRKK
jgi:benzoate membrane transport protein